jgi:hypothetical protein
VQLHTASCMHWSAIFTRVPALICVTPCMVALDVTDCPCRLTVSRRATGVAFSKTGTLHGNDGNLNERAAPGYEFVHERVSLMGKNKSGDLFQAKDISIIFDRQMRSMQLISVYDRSWVFIAHRVVFHSRRGLRALISTGSGIWSVYRDRVAVHVGIKVEH